MSPRFQTLLFALCLACFATVETSSAATSIQSQSGQFVVSRAPSGVRTPAVAAFVTNEQFLELETTLLVVSCDRIRQAVSRDLGLTTPWQGRVNIRLHTATGAGEPITVLQERFYDRWEYRLELPDIIERWRLMRVLVEVMLLETANQQAGERSAELPPWLAVGMAERLLSASEISLLFTPPRMRVGGLSVNSTVVATRGLDPLATARVRLRDRPVLTLQELSWPTKGDFAGETSLAYRASAQLFVSELLRLPEGDACFRALLTELPQYFNWQTAFLIAFHSHFERLLDLEKWWSLQTVAFGGHDAASAWSVAESWSKLDEVLHLPAQVRTAPDQLPSDTASIALQTVVRDWDTMRQIPVLRERLEQFDSLRQRFAPELLPLLADYRRVIADYLEQQNKLGVSLARGRTGSAALKQLIAATVRQLDRLDQRANALRPETPAPVLPVEDSTGKPRR